MRSFYLNGYLWTVVYVPPDDERLIDRTGKFTVATTDPVTLTICVSNDLSGDFLTKVLMHEVSHCILLTTPLMNYIHKTVPVDKWIETEEWVCNLIAEYGYTVINIVEDIKKR